MKENLNLMPEASLKKVPLKFVIEEKEYQICKQYITGTELKQIAKIPLEVDLFLSINRPYDDELIENDKEVNLARPEIEHFYVKKKLRFTINGVHYVWYKQFIYGKEIRSLGNIPEEEDIYLDLPEGWKDDFITNDEIVDLARPGVEKFISKCQPDHFNIYVNGREKEWDKRIITYEEVVKLAFKDPNFESIAYTVIYSGGPRQNIKGTMTKGDNVLITNKMNFNVTETSRS